MNGSDMLVKMQLRKCQSTWKWINEGATFKLVGPSPQWRPYRRLCYRLFLDLKNEISAADQCQWYRITIISYWVELQWGATHVHEGARKLERHHPDGCVSFFYKLYMDSNRQHEHFGENSPKHCWMLYKRNPTDPCLYYCWKMSGLIVWLTWNDDCLIDWDPKVVAAGKEHRNKDLSVKMRDCWRIM